MAPCSAGVSSLAEASFPGLGPAPGLPAPLGRDPGWLRLFLRAYQRRVPAA